MMLPLTLFVASSTRISANPADPASERTISTVSLNLAKETDPDKVVNCIRRAPRLRDADVFLLQEVANQEGKPSVAEQAARRLGYFASFTAAPGAYDQGLALISRYPISDVHVERLKACDLRFRSRSRFVMAASIQSPWNSVRVWNVHLDTRINAEERLEQLRPVLADAARQTGPRLIGGDFNTNDLYWIGNVLPLPGGRSHGGAIRSAMKEHGFETPFPNSLDTFPPFRRHLDWIFLSELKPSAASVEPASFSDHHAIWVRAHI